MNLTLDQWNELGYGMIHFTQIRMLLCYLFQYSYGRNHKYTKLTHKIFERGQRLQNKFDNIVRKECFAVMDELRELPEFEHLSTTDILYKVNHEDRTHLDFTHFILLEGTLEKFDIKYKSILYDSMSFIKKYVMEIDNLLFGNKNNHVEKIIELVDKLDAIVGEIEFAS